MFLFTLQRESEIRPFDIQTFRRLVFKWSCLSYDHSYSPAHSQTGTFKIQTFLSRFQWLLTKWRPFIRILNDWASGCQIPFEIQTICNSTSFWPFKIQNSPDFRSPLLTEISTSLFVHSIIMCRGESFYYLWNTSLETLSSPPPGINKKLGKVQSTSN